MKFFALSILAAAMMMVNTGHAQMIKDNTQWTFEAKKKAGNQYEIVAHVKLEKGWHVYAMKPGGDGSLIPVAITYDKNNNVKLTGSIKEKGKLISESLVGIDGKVNMYKDKVDYYQQATITALTTITGEYTYQICNDKTCLPPTTKKLSIAVK